jgi:outer membrane receptor protein involved in Fe transport
MRILRGLFMDSLLLFILLASILAVTSLKAAELRGTVTGPEGDGLIGANVIVKQLDGDRTFGAATDLDGNFRVMQLPAGEYLLLATCLGFEESQARQITVSSRDTVMPFNFSLKNSAVKLEDVVVKAGSEKGSIEATLEDRMASMVIVDAIGGEEIKRMPDPDVAKVIRRSTGVSTEGGDPVIRGLGVRYSKVSLNNSVVSGTEPNRSSVSLDLFPAALMRNLTVSKAYSADKFGEFGGGQINMDTWELGGAPVLSVSMSTGFNSETSFKDFATYDGGSLDMLGYDDGTRDLPGIIDGSEYALEERGMFSTEGYTAAELTEMGSSFNNTWEPVTETALPGSKLSASVGQTISLFNRPVDMLLSGSWGSSPKAQSAARTVYKGGSGGAITAQHTYAFSHYEQDVTLGGLAGFTWQGGDWSRYRFNLFYNHSTEDETRIFSGYNDDRGMLIRDTRLRMVTNSVASSQISGHHVIPGLGYTEMDWMVAGSRGLRSEPDTREYQYEVNTDNGIVPSENSVWRLADETQSGSRMFGDLQDNSANLALDFTVPLGSSHDSARLKTGVASVIRRRDSELRFFQFEVQDGHTLDLSANPESIFAPENMGSDGILVKEYTRPTDSYKADQDLYAGYAMLDFQPMANLKANIGLRYEVSDQEVTSYQLFTATETPVRASIRKGDILPALNLTWQASESTNYRMALSQTVSRPDFREMSEFEFTDIIGGHAVIGNPNLDRALIQHVDLRWETRYGVGDFASASVFYKHFDQPIEVVIQPTAQNRVSYENADEAHNYGAEFEIRQGFERMPLIGDGARHFLREFSLSANLTLLKSDIALSDSTKGIQSSSNRPLHGQSPYLANLNLRYESEKWGSQMDLFFHIEGKRIAEVGAKPLPDIYEMPVPELDLSFRQPLSSRLTLSAAAKNILNPEHRFEQGGFVTHAYREGISWSLGLGWSL